MSAADFTPERIAELRATEPASYTGMIQWSAVRDDYHAMLDAIEELQAENERLSKALCEANWAQCGCLGGSLNEWPPLAPTQAG